MRGNVQRYSILSRRVRRFSLSPLLTLLLGFVIGLLASWYWWQMLDEPVRGWESKLMGLQNPYYDKKLDQQPEENFTVESYLNPAKPPPTAVQFIGYSDTEIGYLGRKNVLIGVLTSEQHLMTRAKTIFETWGQNVDNIVFFVGSECQIDRPELANMKFVRLPVPDDEYPPQKKLFAMLQYMANHYVDQYHWFVRADDDVYIRYNPLLELLSKLDASQKLYIGHPNHDGPSDKGESKVDLGEVFCMGGPGVLLSRVLLKDLEPNLDLCQEAIDHYHFKSSTQRDSEDLELGRCISRILNIQCSKLQDERSLFYHDYQQSGNDITSLWFTESYRHVLSIHPVKESHEMLRIHHFFAMVDFSTAKRTLAHDREELDIACRTLFQLSISFVPPWIAIEICDGDVTCGCGTQTVTLAGTNYHLHLGQFGVSNEDTWVRYFNQTEAQSGVVRYEVPSTCSHQRAQSHEVNVTSFLNYVNYFIPSNSASIEFRGGLIQYGWLTGMQVFVHASPTYPTPKRKSRKFDGYYSFQFITHLPTETVVGQERIGLTSVKLLHMVIVVEAGDPQINQFISDHLSILPRSKSPVKIMMMVFVTKGKIRKINTRRNSNIAVTYGRGQFSWEKGVEVALKRLSDDSLVFVGDINLNIKQEFVDRCNKFSSPERLYFPTPVGCRTLDSDCIGSRSVQTCKVACGHVSSVREWFRTIHEGSSHQHVYKTTAVDPSLYVRNLKYKYCL